MHRVVAPPKARLRQTRPRGFVARALPRAWRRFYYATQLRAQPPTIALFSNTDEPLHFSYRRYLENQFRDALALVGCPVHFVIRARKGMKRER